MTFPSYRINDLSWTLVQEDTNLAQSVDRFFQASVKDVSTAVPLPAIQNVLIYRVLVNKDMLSEFNRVVVEQVS